MTSAEPATLVLKYADVGVATYASLRVIGDRSRTVTWVVEEPFLVAARAMMNTALPIPSGGETTAEALSRALTTGPFADPDTELRASYQLGLLLLSHEAWALLESCVAEPRPVLHITPTARLATIPFAMMALPTAFPTAEEMVAAKQGAVSTSGEVEGRLPWEPDELDDFTDGYRLMELADVVLSPPVSIVASASRTRPRRGRHGHPPTLVLDPKVPGQRPDSPLGSVLGRPTPESAVSKHFGAVDAFRRSDTDRVWLSRMLQQGPSRLMFVGHASAAPGGAGYAERAAIHLSCDESVGGRAEVVGSHRPFTAADLMAEPARWPMPPRVALVACESGGDYRFDEAHGMVAAIVLAGAELVTATLWSLPTTAGFRRFAEAGKVPDGFDPMAELIIAVDTAHESADAALMLGRWQRAQMRRWRAGDRRAHPVYWGALVTFVSSGRT